MKNEVKIDFNKKKLMKKLDGIAKEKYSSTYAPPEYSESNFLYSPEQTLYTPKNFMFTPMKKTLFGQPEENIPSGYHKIKCNHCENVIAIPMGYSNCPKCGKMVYADKNTVFIE